MPVSQWCAGKGLPLTFSDDVIFSKTLGNWLLITNTAAIWGFYKVCVCIKNICFTFLKGIIKHNQ